MEKSQYPGPSWKLPSGLKVKAMRSNRSQAQANHAALSGFVDPASLPLRMAIEAGHWRLDTPEGLAAIAEEVSRQALVIAYLQDFRLLMWVSLATVPLVVLLQPGAAGRRG